MHSVKTLCLFTTLNPLKVACSQNKKQERTMSFWKKIFQRQSTVALHQVIILKNRLEFVRVTRVFFRSTKCFFNMACTTSAEGKMPATPKNYCT